MKIYNFAFVVLLFSCSTNKGDSTINVSLPDVNEEFTSWLDIFPSVEMIHFTGEQLPVFSPYSHVGESFYYVVDRHHAQKVHRFNQKGIYLSSVGNHGRGPNEYIYMTDVIVDNHECITIFSAAQSAVFNYFQDGSFWERKELSYKPRNFASLRGFYYYYIGSGYGTDYQLYVTDSSGQTTGQFLPSSSVPEISNRQKFSKNGNTLNLCPLVGNHIYRLHDGKMEVNYIFDFGVNNVPNKYYTYNDDDFESIIGLFINNRVALKQSFHENRHCAILEIAIMEGAGKIRTIYGILNKQKGEWKWINWTEDDYIYLQCLDDEYAYFIADHALMKQSPLLTGKFPLLHTVTNNDGLILKCKTHNAD